MNIMEEAQVELLSYQFDNLTEDELEAANERIDVMLSDIPDRPEQLRELYRWASEFNQVVYTALLGHVKYLSGGFDND